MACRKASKGTSQGAEMWNELSISMNKNGFCQSVYSHPIKITEGRFCKWINCLFKMFIHFCEQPFSRLGPINTLIWMDQINGILLAYSIISRIFFIVSSVPFSSMLGVPFCTFSRSMAYAYITGSFVWSCFIAIYRVLYIKAHR